MLFDLWYDFLKACSPLEGYIRYLILSLLDTRTNIRTYRAAIAAKNCTAVLMIAQKLMHNDSEHLSFCWNFNFLW